MEESVITSVKWIPKGFAKSIPEKFFVLNASDPSHLSESLHQDEEHREKELQSSLNGACDSSTSASDIDEDYVGTHFFSTLKSDLQSIEADQNIVQENEDSEEDALEREADEIQPDDCLMLTASADQVNPSLEVYVYDYNTSGLYVHHEVMVGSAPLCIEWLGNVSTFSQYKNFCATGYLNDSVIDIWNLDIIDQLEPSVVLGKSSGNRIKTNLSNEEITDSSSVLCLHKSPTQASLLLSGSADNIVRLWNIEEPTKPVQMYLHHSKPVQTVKWHPLEASVALSSAYDKTVTMFDVRSTNNTNRIQLKSDEIEVCIWDRHNPALCLISFENGCVQAHDMRKLSSSDKLTSLLWSVQAHEKACTSIEDSTVPGLLVTASMDGFAKVWKNDGISNMTQVYEKDLKAGPIFSAAANPDLPFVFSFASLMPVIWDLEEAQIIAETFSSVTK